MTVGRVSVRPGAAHEAGVTFSIAGWLIWSRRHKTPSTNCGVNSISHYASFLVTKREREPDGWACPSDCGGYGDLLSHQVYGDCAMIERGQLPGVTRIGRRVLFRTQRHC